MLGKLIKHDFRNSYKLMFISHAFILLLSGLIGGTLWFHIWRSSNVEDWSMLSYSAVAVAIAFLYIIVIATSVFGTQLYIAVRFYKNLFTDEGYLMHTLPTTPTQLLHSKLITGLCWALFNILIVVASIALLLLPALTQIADANMFFQFLEGFQYFEINGFLYILTMILGAFDSLMRIFGCICIGQLFYKNRVLAAIIAYLVTNMIIQFFTAIASLANQSFFLFATMNATENVLNYNNNLILAIVITCMTSILFYTVSYYIMNKKVNLV